MKLNSWYHHQGVYVSLACTQHSQTPEADDFLRTLVFSGLQARDSGAAKRPSVGSWESFLKSPEPTLAGWIEPTFMPHHLER